MEGGYIRTVVYAFISLYVTCEAQGEETGTIQLPPFSELTAHYPGFKHFGGKYRNHDIVRLLDIGDSAHLLLHDTTALRLSYVLNEIGNQHSIGSDVVRLSQYGTDSVPNKSGAQYIFHPLAFGPFLADKYGYPTVTKMHLFDPVKTKESFMNKQGVMRVITYTQKDNEPKGHIALWDCDGFYQARDFFYGHTLLSVEFWESTDSNCSKDVASLMPEKSAKSKQAEDSTESKSTQYDVTDNTHNNRKPPDTSDGERNSNLLSVLNQLRRRPSHHRHHDHD